MMMKVVSGTQIKRLDQAAVAAGISTEELMENAGSGVARIAAWHALGRRVVVIAGKGGNGGDALVAARILARAGFRVQAFTTVPPAALTGATLKNATALMQTAPGSVKPLTDLDACARAIARADVVIDGLLGVGVDRPVTGLYRAMVHAINRATGLRVAVDLPSGIPSDSGTLIGDAVHADITVCMGALKPACVLYPARDHCGRIEVISVGYPDKLWEEVTPLARVPDTSWVRAHLPARPPTGHKGTFGRVLIVAGSVGMSGAAIMAALGALRSGAGLVTVACPHPIMPIVATAVPEALTLPLPAIDGHLGISARDALADALTRADAVAIGPGLGRAATTGALVRTLLERVSRPVVIDADALFAVSDRLTLLGRVAGRAVLTPHPGEMARLIERTSAEIDADRIAVARAFAHAHGVTLVLKGRPTAIGSPDGDVFLNPTGNTGLATGGSGDVLTGIVAGLIAGGADLTEAAVVGVYLHGYAADYLVRDRSERATIPRDLIAVLPQAIDEIEHDGE